MLSTLKKSSAKGMAKTNDNYFFIKKVKTPQQQEKQKSQQQPLI